MWARDHHSGDAPVTCPSCLRPVASTALACRSCSYEVSRSYPAAIAGCTSCGASMRAGYLRCPRCRAIQPGGHIVVIPLPGGGALEVIFDEPPCK